MKKQFLKNIIRILINKHIYFYLTFFILLQLIMQGCNNVTDKNDNNKDNTQKDIYNNYAIEAPADVYYYLLNEVNSQILNELCEQNINTPHANVTITIRDSIIEDCEVRLKGFKNIYGFIIAKSFLEKKIKFDFIDNYSFASYAFKINIDRLCKEFKESQPVIIY